MISPLFIARVRSSIQGGVDVQLDRHTVLVGPNESGKSAILRAIALVLKSRVYDVEGEGELSAPGDLLRLFPERRGLAWAEITLSDGSTGVWATMGKEGRAKEPLWRPPEAATRKGDAMPLQAALAHLEKGVKLRRNYLLEQVGAGLDVRAHVAADLHDLLKQALPKGDPSALATAIKTCAERVSALQGEIRGMEQLIAAGQPGSPPPTAEHVTALQARIAKGRGLLAALSEVQRAEAVLRKTPGGRTRPELLAALALVIEARIEHDWTTCPACGGEAEPKEAAQERIGKIRERQRTIEGPTATAIAAAKAAKENAPEVIRKAEDLDALAARLEERIAELSAEERRGEETIGRWKLFRESAERKERATKELGRWKRLAAALDQARKTLLEERVAELAERVTAYLGNGMECAIHLVDGTREVCRIGFKRDGVFYDAFSGGTWARFMTAFAAGVLAEDQPFAVLIPPDRGWHPIPLSVALQGLGPVPWQVLVHATATPRPAPSDWTVRTPGEWIVKGAMEPPAEVTLWAERLKKKGKGAKAEEDGDDADDS